MKLHYAAALALVAGCVSGCLLPEWSWPENGTVLDKNTRTPVPRAHVEISGYWTASTYTDEKGRFEIPSTAHFKWFIPIGEPPLCEYTISAAGRETFEESDTCGSRLSWVVLLNPAS